MRKEIVGNDKVFIGRLGDDDVREFAFDLSEYVSCMDGEFSVSCLFVLPSKSDSEAYAIAIDHYRLEGNQLIWTPTNAECSETGWGKFEAILYNNDQQVATLIWRVQVGKSLVGDEEPPEGWENYILAVEKLVDEIESMTVSASVDANVGTPSVTVETSGGQGEPFSITLAFHNLKGETGGQGSQGVGIASISIAEKSVSGLDVVYTLTATKTDGTTTASDFTVTNGNGIASAELNDDYTLTLTFDDGTSYTTPSIRGEQGEQGETGNGISGIAVSKTATVGLVDTYTMVITYTNGTSETETFEVTNGKDAELSDDLPLMDGTADAGTDTEASRSDHVHPSDTTKEDKGKMTQTVSGYRGGTVAWNQKVLNGNFADDSGWTASPDTPFSVANNEGTFTPSASFRGITTGVSPFITGHSYLMSAFIKSSVNTEIQFVISDNVNFTNTKTVSTETSYKQLGAVLKVTTTVGSNSLLRLRTTATSIQNTEFTVKEFYMIDLTALFGSDTIPNYILSLETQEAGSGVAWFRQYFPLDYYSYDTGTLKSVDAVNYALFGYPRYTLDTVLRGVPKLDADNNLTYDADSEENGTVTRKYGIVDLGTQSWIIDQYRRFVASLNGVKKPSANNIKTDWLVCPLYLSASSNDVATSAGEMMMGITTGGYIVIKNSAYATASAFTAAMSGIYLVYELATPTTESVTSTPVSLTIPPYPPNGDCNLVYENGSLKWVDMQSYINQRIAEVQALILEG